MKLLSHYANEAYWLTGKPTQPEVNAILLKEEPGDSANFVN